MRYFLLSIVSFLLILKGFAQGNNKIEADAAITTIDKIDIDEINVARRRLIKEIIKDGSKTNVFIRNLLQKDYQNERENGHNSDRITSNYYPKEITKTSFLTYYINKAAATRCYDNKRDSLLLDCTKQRQYEFLVVFPYIDGTNHGYNTGSTQFLVHFEKTTKWTQDKNDSKTSVTINYSFLDPVPLLLFYGNKCMTRDYK